MKKRFPAILMVLALLLALAACSDGSGSRDSGSDQTKLPSTSGLDSGNASGSGSANVSGGSDSGSGSSGSASGGSGSGSGAQNESSGSGNEDSGGQDEPEPGDMSLISGVSREFGLIFAGTGIPIGPASFEGLDTVSYAADMGLYLDRQDFGYNEDGIVCAMTDLFWFMVDAETEEERESFAARIREEYDPMGAPAFSRVSYLFYDDYYEVKLDYVEMDNSDHLQVLADLGLLHYSGEGYLSIADVEQELADVGFVKA